MDRRSAGPYYGLSGGLGTRLRLGGLKGKWFQGPLRKSQAYREHAVTERQVFILSSPSC